MSWRKPPGTEGTALAKRWEKTVTSTLFRIVSNPAAGTRCSFQSIDLHDVRRTTIAGFPTHLLFYRLRETDVFILRVVHGARDLENLF
jgi:toxin ParE1/3/4